MNEEMKLLEAQLADQQKIAQKTRDRLESLKKKEEAERLEPLKATAQRLHDLLCPYNHTDGCSFDYEGDNWSANSHNEWLRKVERLVVGDSYTKPKTNLGEIKIILDAVEGIKKSVPTALDLIRRGF